MPTALCAAILGFVMLAGLPARAQLNGTFTNNGSGWAGRGPLTNGSPHVTTNDNGMTVLRIGDDNGAPGVAGGAVTSTGNNRCTGTFTRYCVVRFHADWTPVGNETAKVRVSFKSSGGQQSVTRTITASGDHVVNMYDECYSLVQVTFSIDSGGNPVNSTLDISAVSIGCELFDHSTLLAQAAPAFGDPPRAGYPLPLSGGSFGIPPQDSAMLAQIPAGLSPLAKPFDSGDNSLDAVLPADDNTVLYKYNPQTGTFDSYYSTAGMWEPAGGTLGPGDAAFIYSPVPQQFDFFGQYAPMPFGKHPSSGSAYFANPVDWPVQLEDVMGFKPVVGDAVIFFRQGDTNIAPPGTVDSGFVFQPDNFASQPTIPAGETVQVFFADPSKVPIEILPMSLTSAAPISNILVTAPGDLPSSGVLQCADSLGSHAQWKSLMGVADYYSEPATNPARFFRLGFSVPTGYLFGSILGSNGAPASGLNVQLAPNGDSQTPDNSGRFSFFNVPIGLVDLNISAPVQVFDPVTSQSAAYTVSLPLTVTQGTATSVNIKESFTAFVMEPPQPPTCLCKPWCGIIGGTINGVQKVVAGGGSLPNPCPDCPCTVTITGPRGININVAPGAHMVFSPAANGVWTVTSTVCGITKTCSISLP
jgi:hypothetical protein